MVADGSGRGPALGRACVLVTWDQCAQGRGSAIQSRIFFNKYGYTFVSAKQKTESET